MSDSRLKGLLGLGDESSKKSYYPELLEKIKALTHSKEYITDIINSMPSAMICVDDNFGITQLNSKACEVFKCDISQSIGKRLEDVCPSLIDDTELISNCVIETKIGKIKW